jgi:putative transposase
MARLPRLTLPGYAHHVIQRGNNRQAIFLRPLDRTNWLQIAAECAHQFHVAIHAYVLMDNHFHLLATPATAEGLPKMMQALGRRYVRYFNDQHGRTGTLWEGRYKSTVVQAETHLLPCMAYMDLNPVRAGFVNMPQDYLWSSYGHYVGQRVDRLITVHPMVWAMGNTPFSREAAYADLAKNGVEECSQLALTEATLGGWALGDRDFVAELQKRIPRRVTKGSPGRPPANLGL